MNLPKEDLRLTKQFLQNNHSLLVLNATVLMEKDDYRKKLLAAPKDEFVYKSEGLGSPSSIQRRSSELAKRLGRKEYFDVPLKRHLTRYDCVAPKIYINTG